MLYQVREGEKWRRCKAAETLDLLKRGFRVRLASGGRSATIQGGRFRLADHHYRLLFPEGEPRIFSTCRRPGEMLDRARELLGVRS